MHLPAFCLELWVYLETADLPLQAEADEEGSQSGLDKGLHLAGKIILDIYF